MPCDRNKRPRKLQERCPAARSQGFMNKIEFVQQQESLLQQLRKWCGAIPAGGPLNIIEKERREYRTHTEIKLSYDGDPGERIPAYLLIPRGIGAERRPAIFAAHQCAWACDIGKEQVVGNEDYPNICEEAKKCLPPAERMAAKHDVHKQAKKFYGLYAQDDGLELFVFNGGHQFPEAARKASYAFLKRHLMPQ